MEYLFGKEKEENLKSVEEFLKQQLSESRFVHTLGVKEEISRMGEIFLPNEIYELQIAALLHDVTKQYPHKKQLQLCEKFGIILNTADISAKAVIHSRTGAYFAYEKFPLLVSEKISSAIYKHTLASENMSTFDKLLFLSDITEKNRTYKFSVSVRDEFWSEVNGKTPCEAMTVLDKIILKVLDRTIENLVQDGKIISMDTILARNAFLTENSYQVK